MHSIWMQFMSTMMVLRFLFFVSSNHTHRGFFESEANKEASEYKKTLNREHD